MKRDRLSLWLADEGAILSLFVAPRGNEARPLSLGGCRRGGKSLIIYLAVGLLVGKGRRSLSGWINWNRKVRFFLAVALVDGDIWLSVGGSPPRRRSSLSMPLRDSYSVSLGVGSRDLACNVTDFGLSFVSMYQCISVLACSVSRTLYSYYFIK
ncbi:hypothetical protein Bca52824_059183 [Brassica carinata]|uniref:Uncharacterized protein n=1 Tax=Brassica carinata TaxID=52824 RepID=A0A8X7QW31_BRACI|nr:hypothetical protein Bca52824_059183 [Brassica carinata]